MAMYIYIYGYVYIYIYISCIYLVQYSSYILQIREHMGTKKKISQTQHVHNFHEKKHLLHFHGVEIASFGDDGMPCPGLPFPADLS